MPDLAPAPASFDVVFPCPRCGLALAAANGAATVCPGCDRRVSAWVFRRAFEPVAAAGTAQPAAASGEAVCFVHAASAAERPCDGCGRYMCALCDVELNGGHFCPACLEHPPTGTLRAALVTEEFAYDRLVLALGWLWILFWPSWIVVAPFCWYGTVRYWKTPSRSLIPRRPWRFVAGDALLLWPAAVVVLIVLFRMAR